MKEIREALTFDDVLIEPAYSEVYSRVYIDLLQDLWGKRMNLPIISAAMDYVTGLKMAQEMEFEGGLGLLHRQQRWPLEDIVNLNYPVISIGVKDLDNTLEYLGEVQEFLFAVNVDVAHGHHENVGKTVEKIKKLYPKLKIIAGNVATYDGYSYLLNCGADAIKVGIGPGSTCTTRTVTGVGVPQLTAIMDCARAARAGGVLIADGGIKNSGDIVKALVAGADFVMLGYLLAGHEECPGTTFSSHGRVYKPYRGQSVFGTNGFRNAPEGIEGYVEERGPVTGTLTKLVAGIRSGMSYVGAKDMSELRAKATFIRVSPGTQLETATRLEVI